MQDLKVALIQFDIIWQNPEANRQLLKSKIAKISTGTDLVILPEMFTTGFTMDTVKNAEPMKGITLSWMQKMAAEIKAVITGSIIIKEDNNFYNRLFWVEPNGNYSFYDKRHLFRMADEHEHFSQGNKQSIFELHGWKIKPQICYDLRFPTWSRNINLEYDLIFYVANWPKARVNAWDALLKARAIENLSYSIGVNRIGMDGTSKSYNGHSACYDFKGEQLANKEEDTVMYLTLEKNALEKYRKSFPANLDADAFNITI